MNKLEELRSASLIRGGWTWDAYINAAVFRVASLGVFPAVRATVILQRKDDKWEWRMENVKQEFHTIEASTAVDAMKAVEITLQSRLTGQTIPCSTN